MKNKLDQADMPENWRHQSQAFDRKSLSKSLAVILFSAMGSSAIVLPAQAQVSGAIFTSEFKSPSECVGVDLNIYASKDQVGLNGGPRKPGASALPPGFYHVKVTEPNGTVLGTSVTLSRPIEVLAADVKVDGVLVRAKGDFAKCYRLSDIMYQVNELGAVTGNMGYRDTGNSGGEYKVWISQNPAFPPSESKTDNFKVKSTYPDPQLATLNVRKFYDANANGVKDLGEPLITGWRIDVTLPNTSSVIQTTTSDTFTGTNGTYSAKELDVIQSNWFHTTDTVYSKVIDLGKSETISFGNLCVGAGGGLTLGFWSNQNGKAIFGSDVKYLNAVISLNLRKANGDAFNPSGYADFRTWILSATATNMANMLSAQLAAMKLNVLSGGVKADALMKVPATLGKNYATVEEIMALADASLAAYGNTVSGAPLVPADVRGYQEALKIALDQGNNNLNYVQESPESCPFSFATAQ